MENLEQGSECRPDFFNQVKILPYISVDLFIIYFHYVGKQHKTEG